MKMNPLPSIDYTPVIHHVKRTAEQLGGSGSALYILHKNEVVVEQYWGTHSQEIGAKPIEASSQFHIASVRKNYIGWVAAYAISTGRIRSLDDEVTTYYQPTHPEFFSGVTIRHLLTHTHGLRMSENDIIREFPPGCGWAYRGIGVDTLVKVLEAVLGQTIAEILNDYAFQPLGLNETGWYADETENLVTVIRDEEDANWHHGTSVSGDERNMYVSARDLAKWGNFHLHRGKFKGEQVVSSDIIELVTSVQSPKMLDPDHPQNGFFWFVKDEASKRTEIGDHVPKGAYQLLGYTSVTLLVIPEYDAVVVRAFNRFGSPEGYDYLEDVRSFGDTVAGCFQIQ
ncbi:serine hydrolase domain-containing protein [Chryseomicrobium palamuruense]|uniref:Serine hydrolase domain-containing protein n=1 Tax=Chryseomicrobium palamuruense TaxID=682973 RepID=A0ABV8URA9_9BACL